MSTRRVTITPRINLRMGSSGRSYCGRWGGWGASFASARPRLMQLTDASLCSAEPFGFAQGRLAKAPVLTGSFRFDRFNTLSGGGLRGLRRLLWAGSVVREARRLKAY